MTCVLYVHAKGGPPPSHALARVAAKATVHLLALAEPPASIAAELAQWCASVTRTVRGEERDLVDVIVERAREVGAEAVITFSEYAVVAVSQACLRLGLRGAGSSAGLARDKRLMRIAWDVHRVPQPRFRAVTTLADLQAAAAELSPPLLLKSAWSAGSTAHQVIKTPADAAGAWERSRQVMEESADLGYAELYVPGAREDFVVEEIVEGDARGWFAGEGWGDYVSVEGVVADGIFHPVCLTGRMPTVTPFTERAGITPAAMTAGIQDRIVDLARRAVDALGLEDCGTHTEIKLGADGRMWVIETAARFGGAMTVPQVEQAFGIDLVGGLTDQLLGRDPGWPARVQDARDARGASGSLVVLAVHADGTPWSERRTWRTEDIVRSAPVTPGNAFGVVVESSLPDGELVPEYDPAAGANTMAGLCTLSADDPQSVLDDLAAVIDAMPSILRAPRTRGSVV
ncbi:acetyl-CoA carboxylase biotin carboxylase subunit family protein [Streptomyces sp. NPDC058701]|uniref:ATP-grasp domain-containing protein n=1 Tax=Streptomyces sp. NPDC058701 TaxID=3346608 RepID=UPI00364F74C1